jgi:hypothetical protein
MEKISQLTHMATPIALHLRSSIQLQKAQLFITTLAHFNLVLVLLA